MTGIPDLGIRGTLWVESLTLYCVCFVACIQSVGIGACMHVCVWYTELTCISNGVSKTDIVRALRGKVLCVCVCVCVLACLCVCVVYRADLYTVLGL